MKLSIILLFILTACSSIQADANTCGGYANIKCQAEEYCKFDSNCGAGDISGICEKKPKNCNRMLLPVCACNGKTYPNECVAKMAGVSIARTGNCEANNKLKDLFTK